MDVLAGSYPSTDANRDRVILQSAFRDEKSGALYVHRDLDQVLDPFEAEEHLGHVKQTERFATIEDWCWYVGLYGVSIGGGADGQNPSLVTYNRHGLRAVLDYHGTTGGADFCEWLAEMPLQQSREIIAWQAFANGRAQGQAACVEFLEEHADHIAEPDAGGLMNILRSLRANVKATAESELRPDGTVSIKFAKDQEVKTAGELDLPPEFKIVIPILQSPGDTYKLPVRIRVSIGDDAKLALRFSLQGADKALDELIAVLVDAARVTLGEGYRLLRVVD